MKSQFFKDMQGLGTAPNLAGRISVCLLLNRDAYLQAVQEAARLGITSGDYIDRLMMKAEAFAIRSGGRSPRVAKQFIELCKSGVQV